MSDADPRFQVFAELTAFEKAGDANPYRIGGIVSTDSLDKQDEAVVQEGLDFRDFLKDGWYNDNHGAKATDILGYPTAARLVQKGDVLPDGTTAQRRGWWTEGYLLDDDAGKALFAKARALRGTPRRLGFSIEGKVVRRDPSDPRRIAAARVRHVAITHVPVNPDTHLSVLAKALTAGQPSSETFASRAGGDAGDGAPLAAAGGDVTELEYAEEWADAARASVGEIKSKPVTLTKAEARIVVRSWRPNLPTSTVEALVERAARRVP